MLSVLPPARKTRSPSRMSRFGKFAVLVAAVCVSAPSSNAQTKAKLPSAMTPFERRASLNLNAARNNPLQLRNFLFHMPKGADLHNHLAGAIYAETWIRNAADDHLCLDPAALHRTESVFSVADAQRDQSCANGKIPAAAVYKDQHLYD